MNRLLLAAPLGLALLSSPMLAFAADADQVNAPTTQEVVVTAARLNAARVSIQPQIGASTYTFDSHAIAQLPGGDDIEMNQVLLQAPGVAQDSYGQLHIRGEHNGLQYRLNGVILPEGLSVFSQALSPRIADKIQLITGALPAEYGLRTAGIVDITTKEAFDNGGEVSVYGGSHEQFQPSANVGGHTDKLNYFASVSDLHNDLGIESPDGSSDPRHDHTDQFQAFGYLEAIIDNSSKLSFIAGSSINHFQIPDVAGGENGGLGLNVNGQTNDPSQDINESQREVTHYAVASYLFTDDRFTGQVSLFARYSTLGFSPDVVGDLLYDGIAQQAAKSDTAGGVQAEGVYKLTDSHTVRIGLITEIDRSTSQTTSQVMAIDNNPSSPTYGQQLSNQPVTIIDDGAKAAETYSLYLQDEWKILPSVTLNYGLRYDDYDGYRNESQLSPRINMVWKPFSGTTFHAGYARYFTPPPFELIGAETVSKFSNLNGNPLVTTSAAPLTAGDTTPYAERANYFDIGVEQVVLKGLTASLDSYYKLSTHMIDEGQFGAPIILTPFNYAKGRQYGIEFNTNYVRGPLSSYVSFAYSVAQGQDWITSQFNFDQPSIDYVSNHWIYLDHDARFTGSAGVSYLWRGTRFGGDLIYGSGLRADLPLATPIATPDGPLAAIPNGAELGPYTQVNLSISHKFKEFPTGPVEVRLDVINALDDAYQIRNGSGVGVFAPQYGPRRGVFVGLTKSFG